MKILEYILIGVILLVFGYFMYSHNASGLIGSALTLCSGALLNQLEMGRNTKSYEIQYSALKDTVWIHCSTGETVGRFGMDIHTTVEEQMAGEPQCLRCTHGKPTKQDFQEFCEKAKELWGIDIDQTKVDTSKFL